MDLTSIQLPTQTNHFDDPQCSFPYNMAAVQELSAPQPWPAGGYSAQPVAPSFPPPGHPPPPLPSGPEAAGAPKQPGLVTTAAVASPGGAAFGGGFAATLNNLWEEDDDDEGNDCFGGLPLQPFTPNTSQFGTSPFGGGGGSGGILSPFSSGPGFEPPAAVAAPALVRAAPPLSYRGASRRQFEQPGPLNIANANINLAPPRSAPGVSMVGSSQRQGMIQAPSSAKGVQPGGKQNTDSISGELKNVLDNLAGGTDMRPPIAPGDQQWTSAPPSNKGGSDEVSRELKSVLDMLSTSPSSSSGPPGSRRGTRRSAGGSQTGTPAAARG